MVRGGIAILNKVKASLKCHLNKYLKEVKEQGVQVSGRRVF